MEAQEIQQLVNAIGTAAIFGGMGALRIKRKSDGKMIAVLCVANEPVTREQRLAGTPPRSMCAVAQLLSVADLDDLEAPEGYMLGTKARDAADAADAEAEVETDPTEEQETTERVPCDMCGLVHDMDSEDGAL